MFDTYSDDKKEQNEAESTIKKNKTTDGSVRPSSTTSASTSKVSLSNRG